MPSLEGQVLIVTGSTQGVGEAIALESARLGAAGVVVCGRNAENGQRVAEEVAGIGAESLFVEADLADVDATQSIISACDERFGRVDGLVIAAYSATKGALATFTKNCANGLLHDTIRVNGIMLGWTDTPNEDVVQKQQGSPDDWLSIGEEDSPFGRLLKPYDVAKLTCFLLSSDSGVMTGSLIDQAQRIIGTLSMPDNITGKDV